MAEHVSDVVTESRDESRRVPPFLLPSILRWTGTPITLYAWWLTTNFPRLTVRKAAVDRAFLFTASNEALAFVDPDLPPHHRPRRSKLSAADLAPRKMHRPPYPSGREVASGRLKKGTRPPDLACLTPFTYNAKTFVVIRDDATSEWQSRRALTTGRASDDRHTHQLPSLSLHRRSVWPARSSSYTFGTLWQLTLASSFLPPIAAISSRSLSKLP